MLDWVWYAILSFLPDRYISGSLFMILRKILENYQVSLVLLTIAILHIIGLFFNVVWLRKIMLLFNIGLLLYLTAVSLQSLPVAAGVGYLIILISVSIFGFWRMDEKY